MKTYEVSFFWLNLCKSPHFSASLTALHHGLHPPAAVLAALNPSHHLTVCRWSCNAVLPQLTAQSAPQPSWSQLPDCWYQGESTCLMNAQTNVSVAASVDFKCKSLLLQDGARKAALLEENNNLMSYFFNDAKTLYEVFQRGLRISGNPNTEYELWLVAFPGLQALTREKT